MAVQSFSMSGKQIAKTVGTVGSPLIVISELLKNAVDASAENIDIHYDCQENSIVIENDHRGFSVEEIDALSTPGVSAKKAANNLENDHGMFLIGSKGLGLLSVFLLCDKAEILTVSSDQRTHQILLDKTNGTVDNMVVDQKLGQWCTRITLQKVSSDVMNLLSSEPEITKLRHICSYLYRCSEVPFPKMRLFIDQQDAREINFSCNFPPMLYDVRFAFSKRPEKLSFQCVSPKKLINKSQIEFVRFDQNELQEEMSMYYNISKFIPTRTNEQLTVPSSFGDVPSFDGRILVYEKNLAGAELKAYGAGVNIYVNDFALYDYLAEENDWLGLADYSQRKKATRLKPHNVFGYVNFPRFNENAESLRTSNERAGFIKDQTFTKLMYLLRGVVMFVIFSIDIADKNPTYKKDPNKGLYASEQENCNTTIDVNGEQYDEHLSRDSVKNSVEKEFGNEADFYSPENAYKPKQNIQKCLRFTKEDGQIIDALKDVDDLSNKIYNLAFELSNLDLQKYQYSVACLYRALVESATKYLCKNQQQVFFVDDHLENSVGNALNYFGNAFGKKDSLLPQKVIKTWREVLLKEKTIDTLNEYIHNESPVDAYLLQQRWNTTRGYIIACLTVK